MSTEYPYFPCSKGADPLGAWSCELPGGHAGNCRKPAISVENLGSAGGAIMADHASRLESLLSQAEKVIVFSMARLDVLTYPGWPGEAMRELGAYYRDLKAPDDEAQRKRELGLIWLDFANEVKTWEDARKLGIHKQLLQEMNLKSPAVALLRHATTEQVVKSPNKIGLWAWFWKIFLKK